MFFQKTQDRKIHDAQQNFFRAVHRIWDVMPGEEGREFMVGVADPGVVSDWETGALIGDPCPDHPDEELCMFSPSGNIHLECAKCSD